MVPGGSDRVTMRRIDPNMSEVIRTENLTKVFHVGSISIPALRGIDLSVNAGEFVAVMGSSGSGKSTLMNLVGCLDVPTDGIYLLDGERADRLSKNDRSEVRNRKIGFVFQGFNLLARTTALENVSLPLFYDRRNHVRDHRKAALEALARVGLEDRVDHTSTQLSGGQQQRVAIARALVNKPSLVLADEPTGNLDSRTSIEIMALFQQLNREGVTVILVTHEHEISQYAHRVVVLRDGLIVRDRAVETVRDAARDLAALPVQEEVAS